MKKRILIIDDELDKHILAIDELEKSYEVFTVRSITSARYFLSSKGPVDFIVLDIMMPYKGIFTDKETDGGMETGIRFLERNLKDVKSKIIIWSRNTSAINELNDKRDEHPNVVEVSLISGNRNQLIELIKKNL